MSTPESVLGVLAVCWVVLPTLHSHRPRIPGLSVGLCKVCKVQARARAHMKYFLSTAHGRRFFTTRGLKKPYQPYTPYTDAIRALFLLVFLCVGFVVGGFFLCWVGFGVGEQGHD